MSISLESSPSSVCYCLWELGYAKEISDARKISNSVGNVIAEQRNIVENAIRIAARSCKKIIFGVFLTFDMLLKVKV
jgi:hypothetical protein